MADTQNTKRFELQKIYLKDASFEAPNSPTIFVKNWKPNLNMQLNSEVKKGTDDIFEVKLSLTITAKVDNTEETAYLVEVQQSGLFLVKGFSDEELGPMLGSYAPSLIYPYAAEAAASLVTKGGFTQLLLSPINFEALYTQKVQQMAAEKGIAEAKAAADSSTETTH